MEKRAYGVEEFLSRPKRLEEEIRGDIDHIASLRSIVEKTTTQLSFTAGRNPSKNEKAFESVMIQIAEEETSLEKKQKHLVEMKLEAENLIKEIPNEKQQKMLRLKYIKGLSFPDIRRIMNLGKTNTYKLYKKAIAAADKNFLKVNQSEPK